MHLFRFLSLWYQKKDWRARSILLLVWYQVSQCTCRVPPPRVVTAKEGLVEPHPPILLLVWRQQISWKTHFCSMHLRLRLQVTLPCNKLISHSTGERGGISSSCERVPSLVMWFTHVKVVIHGEPWLTKNSDPSAYKGFYDLSRLIWYYDYLIQEIGAVESRESYFNRTMGLWKKSIFEGQP